jgi:uncharacterized LabA/DUF88 family protein
MADRTYVFIDGEYLCERHRVAMQDFFGVDGELELSPIMQQARADRVFFYDAIDYAQRADESVDAHQERVRLREQFFSYVRSLNGFHVRPGSVRQGKRREQKEIDVLLAVDMLTQGFTGEMKKAVLIAGDLDFRPAVEELVRHGIFVDVWFDSRSCAEELAGAADYGHEIHFRQLNSWNARTFKEAHKIPSEQPQLGEPYGELVKLGLVEGRKAELRRHQAGTDRQSLTLWVHISPGDMIGVWDTNEDLIERYVAAQYGPIQWGPSGEARSAGEGTQ